MLLSRQDDVSVLQQSFTADLQPRIAAARSKGTVEVTIRGKEREYEKCKPLADLPVYRVFHSLRDDSNAAFQRKLVSDIPLYHLA